MCQAEEVSHLPDGLEAVVFTADGDMRQALNNLQARRGGGSARRARCLPAAALCFLPAPEPPPTPARPPNRLPRRPPHRPPRPPPTALAW